MGSISHVLIATDGSAGALKAAAFGGELAKACNATVSVIFVQSDDVIVHEAWGAGSSMSVNQVRETLSRRVEETQAVKGGTHYGWIDDFPRTLRTVGPDSNGSFRGCGAVGLWGCGAMRHHPPALDIEP